jgi:hypothetical protein
LVRRARRSEEGGALSEGGFRPLAVDVIDVLPAVSSISFWGIPGDEVEEGAGGDISTMMRKRKDASS